MQRPRIFEEQKNRQVLKRLEQRGVNVREMPSKPQKQTLKNKTFVFTGELDHYTRSEAHEAVERLGGRATSSVSSNTDYVVVGANPGGKVDDAHDENVKTLDEGQFEQLLSR